MLLRGYLQAHNKFFKINIIFVTGKYIIYFSWNNDENPHHPEYRSFKLHRLHLLLLFLLMNRSCKIDMKSDVLAINQDSRIPSLSIVSIVSNYANPSVVWRSSYLSGYYFDRTRIVDWIVDRGYLARSHYPAESSSFPSLVENSFAT